MGKMLFYLHYSIFKSHANTIQIEYRIVQILFKFSVTSVYDQFVNMVQFNANQNQHEDTADDCSFRETVNGSASSSTLRPDCNTMNHASTSAFPIEMGNVPRSSEGLESTQIDKSKINVAADRSQPIVQHGKRKDVLPVDGNLDKVRKLNDVPSDTCVETKQCQARSTQQKHFINPNDQTFVCNFCPKSFVKLEDIDKHTLKKHGDTFPFRCENCKSGFSYEVHCKYHEKKCKKRKYECYLCKDIRRNKISLQYHIRSQHSGDKSFGCSLCPERFYINGSILQHMKRKHNKTKRM